MRDDIKEALRRFKIETSIINEFDSPLATVYQVDLGYRILSSGQRGASQRASSYKQIAEDIGILLGNDVVVTIEQNKLLLAVVKHDREPIWVNDYPSSGTNVFVGLDIFGNPIHTDLVEMPHLLVGGTTGSGKSVFNNSLIYQLAKQNKPEQLKLILCDPKQVEFAPWANLPHMLIDPLTNVSHMYEVIQWLIKEMEKRYAKMRQAGTRIKLPEMPYIFCFVEELADIKLSSYGDDVERYLQNLAQKSRATGIHLILATQRPDANTITGTLKSNIPSRIAFSVASGTDSRIILDSTGAENLTGRGHFLFRPIGKSPLMGVSAFVSDDLIKDLVPTTSPHKLSLDSHLENYKRKPKPKPLPLVIKGLRFGSLGAYEVLCQRGDDEFIVDYHGRGIIFTKGKTVYPHEKDIIWKYVLDNRDRLSRRHTNQRTKMSNSDKRALNKIIAGIGRIIRLFR
jgi:DNA segregation ATPase FtsK/SpoIIIE, S-DNA-T family